MRQGIRELAQRNQELEQSLPDKRSQVAVVRATDYTERVARYQQDRAEAAALYEQHRPDRAVKALEERARSLEEAARDTLRSFELGHVPHEAFVDRYIQDRMQFHIKSLTLKSVRAATAAAK